MGNEWIQVSYIGNGWSNITVYVNPVNETAKICSSKCTHWGYHDESEWDEREEIVSIEQALAQVYPDEKAIAAIVSNTKKDYSDTLKKLKERNKKPNDKVDKSVDNENTALVSRNETVQSAQIESVPDSNEQSDTYENPKEKIMERKIQWNSGCFDEIDLVYNKAAEKEMTSKSLTDLEVGALAEAKAYSDKIVVEGRPLTPQQFDALPDSIKEQVMWRLSGMGLASFSAPLTEPKIVVRLSPYIQHVRCCTAFSILNRLEKLDGAFNMLHPQATLEIQAPLGGKQGLVQIEMLIAMLYPWLKVTEVSSNEVAANLMQTQAKPQEQKTSVPTQTQHQRKPVDEAKNTQPGFWARLFGKKK